jgi:hypothetical protein
MKVHSFVRDVQGAEYRSLIGTALRTQHSFSLTWADGLRFGPSAQQVEQSLAPLELGRRRSSRWPGTMLIGHLALVVTYRASDEALVTLLKPGSLFSWRSPDWPEDLAFYSREHTCSLASVSHERDAWVLDRRLARQLGQFATFELEDLLDTDVPVITGAA